MKRNRPIVMKLTVVLALLAVASAFAAAQTARAEEKGTQQLTFAQMEKDAKAAVKGIAPKDAQKKIKDNPKVVFIDVRDSADLKATGVIPGSINIAYGNLMWKADSEVPAEWKDQRVQDRSLTIITTCDEGPTGAIAARLLKDMGFKDVQYLEGGVNGWKKEGLPTDPG